MNRVKPAVVAFTAVAIALSGCDSGMEERYDEVSIQTNQEGYQATPEQVITFTIKNLGKKDVYQLCGGGYGLEQWRGGRLEHSWIIIGMQCLRVDTRAAGEEWKKSWRLTDSYFAGGPTPDFSKEVRYRLRALIYEDKDLRALIDDESQRSNEFEILSEASLERE